MGIDRRDIIRGMAAVAATGLAPAAGAAEQAEAQAPRSRGRVRKIATEEACSIPEVAARLGEVARTTWKNLDIKLVNSIYNAPAAAPNPLLRQLLDLDKVRLAVMDQHGVDMHVLSLTAPGVQMFDADTGTALAALANDRIAEVMRRRPSRFAGLASFAPQDPARAVKEMERAIRTLGFGGFIVNSHTNDEYLDERKYWPILEAAEALDAAIYIHPRAPSGGMAKPFDDYRLEAAVWGYGIEVGTHAVRLMMSGVLDRFEKLKIVLGHMGEAVPFWLWRLDYMGAPGRQGRAQKLKASEYFARNFWITTSGVEDPLALRYAIDKIGADRVMWAIDYPYQPTAPAVAWIDAARLTDDEREKICHGNAERVFKIKI
jgi:2,3-dihydroxybenzoate decarboxylase/5-carboxyvanillate decarboxylase